MKGRKHKPEQIIKKPREAESLLATGKIIGQVAQTLEISEQTFHRWRKQFGGMRAEEAKRLMKLEEQNKRLTKLVACSSGVKRNKQESLRSQSRGRSGT